MAVGTVGTVGVHIGVGLVGTNSRMLVGPPSSCISGIGRIVDPLTVLKYFAAQCAVASCLAPVMLPGLHIRALSGSGCCWCSSVRAVLLQYDGIQPALVEIYPGTGFEIDEMIRRVLKPGSGTGQTAQRMPLRFSPQHQAFKNTAASADVR